MDVWGCAHGVNQVFHLTAAKWPVYLSPHQSSPARLYHFDKTCQEQMHCVSGNGRDLITQTTHQSGISLQEANWLAVFTWDTTANKWLFFTLTRLRKFWWLLLPEWNNMDRHDCTLSYSGKELDCNYPLLATPCSLVLPLEKSPHVPTLII